MAYGTTMVHLEAGATDPYTDGVGLRPDHTTCPPTIPNSIPDYTTTAAPATRTTIARPCAAVARLLRRHRFQARPFARTWALVWRDPGNIAAWPCTPPPSGIPLQEVVAFDDRENVGEPGAARIYATQKVRIAPSSFLSGLRARVIHYGLAGSNVPDPVGNRRQSYVSHVYGDTRSAERPHMADHSDHQRIADDPRGLLRPALAPCSDGQDNDSTASSTSPTILAAAPRTCRSKIRPAMTPSTTTATV
jgi:hypothetical protein